MIRRWSVSAAAMLAATAIATPAAADYDCENTCDGVQLGCALGFDFVAELRSGHWSVALATVFYEYLLSNYCTAACETIVNAECPTGYSCMGACDYIADVCSGVITFGDTVKKASDIPIALLEIIGEHVASEFCDKSCATICEALVIHGAGGDVCMITASGNGECGINGYACPGKDLDCCRSFGCPPGSWCRLNAANANGSYGVCDPCDGCGHMVCNSYLECATACANGMKNAGETGIDCGGPCTLCSTAQASCSDGVQNQGETGTDCGPPCPIACCPSGNGMYCGSTAPHLDPDSLYSCKDGVYSNPKKCGASGCVKNPPGKEDACSSTTCGNGVIDLGEKCDGNCPSSCDDSNACTVDTMHGSASTCDAACQFISIAACTSGDNCCPLGCNEASDGDCPASCGNGVQETGENCANCQADAPCLGSGEVCSGAACVACGGPTQPCCGSDPQCSQGVCNGGFCASCPSNFCQDNGKGSGSWCTGNTAVICTTLAGCDMPQSSNPCQNGCAGGVCLTCTPDCTLKCGMVSDGCTGYCNSCPTGYLCSGQACIGNGCPIEINPPYPCQIVVPFDETTGWFSSPGDLIPSTPRPTHLSIAPGYFTVEARIFNGFLEVGKTSIGSPPSGNSAVSVYWDNLTTGTRYVRFQCPVGDSFECTGSSAAMICSGGWQLLTSTSVDSDISCGLGKLSGTSYIDFVAVTTL